MYSIMEVVNPIFNLGGSRKKDKSIDRHEYIVYTDISKGSLMQPGAANPHEFTLKMVNPDNVTVPAQSFLKLSLKITKEDYTDILSVKSTLSNYVASMFKRVELQIGDQIVESIHDWAGHLLKCEALTDYTEEFVETIGSLAGFFKGESDNEQTAFDLGTVNHFGSKVVARSATNDQTELATEWNSLDHPIGKMYARSSLGKEMHFILPLNMIFPIFKYWPKYLTGMTWQVKFEINNQPYLNVYNETATTAATRGRVEFINSGAELHVSTVTPSPEVRAMVLSNKANNHREVIEYMDHEIKVFDITNQTSVTNAFTMESNTRLSHCMIFFQESDRLTQTSSKDPMRFDKVNITKLYCTLNGEKYPRKDIELDFSKQDYTIPFLMMQQYNDNVLQSFNSDYKVRGSTSYRDWALNPVYYIDLSSGYSSNSGINNQLSVSLTRTSTTPMKMFVVGYYEKSISIEYGTSKVTREQVRL